MVADSLLNRYLKNPLDSVLSGKITSVSYNDCSDEQSPADFGFDKKISLIVEASLYFDSDRSLSLTWLFENGWPQYVLSCFTEPQYNNNQAKDVSGHDLWSEIIGKRLVSYEVFGEKEVPWPTNQEKCDKEKEVFLNVPSMVRLNFSGHQVAFANFCYEDNCEPRVPYGDDL